MTHHHWWSLSPTRALGALVKGVPEGTKNRLQRGALEAWDSHGARGEGWALGNGWQGGEAVLVRDSGACVPRRALLLLNHFPSAETVQLALTAKSPGTFFVSCILLPASH